MPQSPLRLIKRCAEYLPHDRIGALPAGLRGIYVLYRQAKKASAREHFDVVYVGMARSGNRSSIRRRLRTHLRRKKGLWTHFSVFEVWDNIRDEEIIELEGLFRHIYKRDAQANRLNTARGFKRLRPLRDNRIHKWPRRTS